MFVDETVKFAEAKNQLINPGSVFRRRAAKQGAAMDVTVPELEYVAVTLAPERHTTRGFGRPPAPLPDVVTLGMPVVQQVTSDLAGADTSLAQFLRDNDSRWKFHIVHLGCSF